MFSGTVGFDNFLERFGKLSKNTADTTHKWGHLAPVDD